MIFDLDVRLSLYEYLSEQLQQIKQNLTAEIADPLNERAEVLRIKKVDVVYVIKGCYSAVD